MEQPASPSRTRLTVHCPHGTTSLTLVVPCSLKRYRDVLTRLARLHKDTAACGCIDEPDAAILSAHELAE